jgi:hypothetical protein
VVFKSTPKRSSCVSQADSVVSTKASAIVPLVPAKVVVVCADCYAEVSRALRLHNLQCQSFAVVQLVAGTSAATVCVD